MSFADSLLLVYAIAHFLSFVWDFILSTFSYTWWNGYTIEVWEWINNFFYTLHGCNYLIILGLKLTYASKMGPCLKITGGVEIWLHTALLLSISLWWWWSVFRRGMLQCSISLPTLKLKSRELWTIRNLHFNCHIVKLSTDLMIFYLLFHNIWPWYAL